MIQLPSPEALAAAVRSAQQGANGSAKPPDENDKLVAGTLPDDPMADVVLLSGPRERRAATIATVLEAWRADGPLVHEPTGIAALDELTGGGPVYGTRWYLSGAPDAGKTALLIQIAAVFAGVFAGRGICVGLLAVDEEPSDLVTRIAQRTGYSRHHCEHRDHSVLADIRRAFADLPIRFYDDGWTIETAAADLAHWAAERAADDDGRPPRAMLGIDSVQTVRCDAELLAERELSEVQSVTARVRAIRAVATQHRLIAVATSELGRAAYASSDPSKRTSALAAAKWSGAIEYSARVLIGLRSVPGESDLIELEIAKNKHGPITTGDTDRPHVYLRIDRRGQTLTETSYEPPPDNGAARRADERAGQATSDDDAMIDLVRAQALATQRALESAAGAAGLPRARARDALERLVARGDVVRLPGRRNTTHHVVAT